MWSQPRTLWVIGETQRASQVKQLPKSISLWLHSLQCAATSYTSCPRTTWRVFHSYAKHMTIALSSQILPFSTAEPHAHSWFFKNSQYALLQRTRVKLASTKGTDWYHSLGSQAHLWNGVLINIYVSFCRTLHAYHYKNDLTGMLSLHCMVTRTRWQANMTQMAETGTKVYMVYQRVGIRVYVWLYNSFQ